MVVVLFVATDDDVDVSVDAVVDAAFVIIGCFEVVVVADGSTVSNGKEAVTAAFVGADGAAVVPVPEACDCDVAVDVVAPAAEEVAVVAAMGGGVATVACCCCEDCELLDDVAEDCANCVPLGRSYRFLCHRCRDFLSWHVCGRR